MCPRAIQPPGALNRAGRQPAGVPTPQPGCAVPTCRGSLAGTRTGCTSAQTRGRSLASPSRAAGARNRERMPRP
eukprot:234505-Lingulodinium_polyedra.AAC.1